MLVYFMHVLYYLQWREKKSHSGKRILLSNFLPNKEIKKEICFDIYKSAYSDNIAWASHLFNVRLTITHFVFYVFGLPSSGDSEVNRPSRMNTQLIH